MRMFKTKKGFLKGGWAQRSQAIQPQVAHVKSDLLLEKSRGDFSPRLTLG